MSTAPELPDRTDNQAGGKNSTGSGNPVSTIIRRQAWLGRAVSPWVQRWLHRGAGPEAPAGPVAHWKQIQRTAERVSQRVEAGRPHEPGWREKKLSGVPRLVLAGVKESTVEQPEANWLEAMPSFEQVQQAVQAARVGVSLPEPPASPATVPAAPPVQAPVKKEVGPSLEEIHRRVQAARAQNPPPPTPGGRTHPAGTERAPTGRRPLTGRIISRVEEVVPRPADVPSQPVERPAAGPAGEEPAFSPAVIPETPQEPKSRPAPGGPEPDLLPPSTGQHRPAFPAAATSPIQAGPETATPAEQPFPHRPALPPTRPAAVDEPAATTQRFQMTAPPQPGLDPSRPGPAG